MPEKVNANQTFDKLVGKAAMPPLPHGEREKREEIEKGGRAVRNATFPPFIGF